MKVFKKCIHRSDRVRSRRDRVERSEQKRKKRWWGNQRACTAGNQYQRPDKIPAIRIEIPAQILAAINRCALKPATRGIAVGRRRPKTRPPNQISLLKFIQGVLENWLCSKSSIISSSSPSQSPFLQLFSVCTFAATSGPSNHPWMDSAGSTRLHHTSNPTDPPSTVALGPPYWQQQHHRHESYSSVSRLKPTLITLEDHTVGNHCEVLWAKGVEIDDHVLVSSGSVPNVGDFVVWNCSIETLDVSLV